MTNSTEVRKRLNVIDQEMTQRKFCSQGHHYMPIAGGINKPVSGGRTRFICVACQKTATQREKTK